MYDLSKRRKDKGYTQSELAKKMGVSTSIIHLWENRTGNMSTRNLIQYSKILNLDPLDVIDPQHEFKRYDDTKYTFDGKPNLNSILSICFELVPKRISKVYQFATVQLEEQENKQITYSNLKSNIKHHDLTIDGEIVDNRNIKLYSTFNKYLEDFYGGIPDDYIKALKVETDVLEPLFRRGQLVFLNQPSSHISSGSFVVVSDSEKLRICQFRATHGDIYLFPLEKRHDGIDRSIVDSRYLWRNLKQWQIKYIVVI